MSSRFKRETHEACSCSNGEVREQTTASKVINVRKVVAPKIYCARRSVKGEVVTLIDVKFDRSGIELTDVWSRAVCKYEVHELMTISPGATVGEDADAIAFFEVSQGGNMVTGDEVRVDGETLGWLIGFDYGHMPNHMNIVLERTGNPSLRLGSVIEFIPVGGSSNRGKKELECC